MDTIVNFLFEASIRTIIIALAVGCVLRAMRVESPAVAHRAWTGVLLIMLFLPVISLWVPRMAIPVLPSTSIHQETWKHALALPGSSLKGKIAEWESAGMKESGDSESPMPDSMGKQPYAGSGMFQIALVLAFYFIGFCFFAVRLLTGMLLSNKLGRDAQRDDMGFYVSGCTVPLTIGLFRTRMLLPLDSQHWNPEKLEAVLAHESEHVRRHDPLVAWLALLNRCIYWFHPVAWWLCGKLAALSEQACDERVLARGHDSGAYAEYLLEFARSVREKRSLMLLGGSSFHGSKLALRIRRIVMSAQAPPMSRGRLTAVAAMCAFAALVPAVGELARAHEAAPRLIPALSTAPDSLSQPDQVRAQAVPTGGSSLPNAAQGTVPLDVEGGPSQPGNSDFSNPSDKSLYETGLKLLEMRQYKEARQVFEKLIADFPGSRFEAPSRLAIADSFYNEGGAENLRQAMYKYNNFIIRFPANPKVQDAELKLIALNFMRSPNGVQQAYADALFAFQQLVDEHRYGDRYANPDWANAYKAEEAINRFLQKYPDSELVPTAKQALLDVQEYLAGGNFAVARFYAGRGNFAGAVSRLKTIIDQYPNFSRIDEVKQLYETLSAAERQPPEIDG